jgi:outer membrane protein assembly factor BamB
VLVISQVSSARRCWSCRSLPWLGAPGDGAAYPEGTPAEAPAVVDGVLFGIEMNAGATSESDVNHLIARNAATGARLWHSPIDAHTHYGSPIVANGVVYAASRNGHLDAWHLPTR